MKSIDEIADTIDVLKKGIKNQLESATVILQLVHQSDDCPENISKILYNQIGALVFCNEELDKLFEYLNLLDCLIDCIS
ncbi:hypothetical protein DWW76_11440 [Coprobacillus sp. AF17-11AC]|uniref:hypothetical protein n=1 Tax=Faecalibacillus intestinalis TaxID=1982626 RepID=UPI000E551892|nr:hypothetical protein [Faecalibacillus intestinalis]RGG80779.1 hypothetical protein DWW80_10085 [Coprobacillus sp. AF17-17AC]RGG83929.1 hypothetical protein DWW76_11440 [Coprobacillus sp. AF17-11AC]